MTKQQERDQFIAQLVRALPEKPAHVVADAARLLMRHAKTHGNLAVAECNGPGDYVNRIPYPEAGHIYAEHQRRIEKKTQQIEGRIIAICAELGLVAILGGDPRGYTVKVKLPTGAYNTLGGREDGYGVPQ